MNDLETLYTAGVALYDAEHFEKSIKTFESAIFKDPMDARFWKGLGSARMMNKEYKSAINAFASWALLEPKNPLPHFHAGECFLSCGNMLDAKGAFKRARELAENDPQLLGKIELLMEIVA